MTKKNFDLALLIVLLAHPAFGVVKMASRRWARETSGPLQTVGTAAQIIL